MTVLFRVAMLVESFFGLGFLLVPALLLAPLGVSLDETSALLARLFGAAIISFPFLLWLASLADDGRFRHGVALTMLAYFLISGVLLLVAELVGQMNARGWIIVALHAVFVGWFGWFAVRGAPQPQRA
jgi:hypothetical protein